MRKGGNGPRRVSPVPSLIGGPAATRASSSTSAIGTAAVATLDHSAGPVVDGSALKVPRALWYSTSWLTRSVFSHSHATANAPASSGAETQFAHCARASASVTEYRTESTA